MPNDYLDKAALLAALTHTHEKTIESWFLGGKVLIREITARQRLLAQQAAHTENPDEPDNALYQAMLIQMAVVDPDSGTPSDPRTRVPLFTVEDIRELVDARFGAVNDLVNEITSLAGLGPAAMFSGSDTADSGERDAGALSPGSGEAAPQDEGQGSGDDGGRSALPDGASKVNRAKPKRAAGRTVE